MMGQCWEVFDHANAVAHLYPGDLLPGVKLESITPSGTAEFEEGFGGVSLDDFTNIPVRIICDNAVLAGADPTFPTEQVVHHRLPALSRVGQPPPRSWLR